MTRERCETNKAVVRELMAAMDRRDWSALGRFVDPGYHDHDPPEVPGFAQGLDGMRALVEIVVEAFPDTRHEITHLVADGDLVAARITATGTHLGRFFGTEPTGVTVTKSGVALYRIANGKIVERWGHSGGGMLEQVRKGAVAG